MSDLVNEWTKKAEGDYVSALREYRARKLPNFDAAGFHAQQCIEKYMKAVLQKKQRPILKIHDLLAILEFVLPSIPELELHRESLAFLNQFSVAYRYPGESAERSQAKKAIDQMIVLRTIFRNYLGLTLD